MAGHWQVDLLRYATVGSGDPSTLILEALGFAAFTVVMFGGALWALYQE